MVDLLTRAANLLVFFRKSEFVRSLLADFHCDSSFLQLFPATFSIEAALSFYLSRTP